MKGKTKSGEAEVRCPYFRMHSPMVIGCEGIIDGSVLMLQFSSGKGRDRHEEIFCRARYENCELFPAISRQYEEG